MSELTSCNYCDLRRIRERAKKNELRVTLARDGFMCGMGGITVYTHPKDVSMKDADEDKQERFFSAWMMEIPDKCCC